MIKLLIATQNKDVAYQMQTFDMQIAPQKKNKKWPAKNSTNLIMRKFVHKFFIRNINENIQCNMAINVSHSPEKTQYFSIKIQRNSLMFEVCCFLIGLDLSVRCFFVCVCVKEMISQSTSDGIKNSKH